MFFVKEMDLSKNNEHQSTIDAHSNNLNQYTQHHS